MSFDLWVWAGPAYGADAIDEALRLFDEEGLTETLDPSPALSDLVRIVTTKYPRLEDLPDGDLDLGVWSVSPEPSDRAVSFSMARARADEVATTIVKEALDLGLFTFDPQDMTIYPPAGADPDRVLTTARRGGTKGIFARVWPRFAGGSRRGP